MQQHIYGLLRVKNESRFIERIIRAIQPVCERILVLDDHSTDGTPELCEALGATVYRSEFSGIDESRDKDWLLQQAYAEIPQQDQHFTRGNPESPYWCLSVDGDEELAAGDGRHLLEAVQNSAHHAYHLRIPFLWDSADQIRVDGVYRRFEKVGRPSLFRLMNSAFRYLKTPFGNGANFHCSSIPQELLGHAKPCAARLWHWGYVAKEDRIRKYIWYNTVDPNNAAEDCYRHMVIGDVFPASAKFKHAGPLQLEPICRLAN